MTANIETEPDAGASTRAEVSRRGLLTLTGGVMGGALLAGPGAALAPQTATAKPVDKRSAGDLWQQYRRSPNRHPQVPNVSFAGYRRGEKALPHRRVMINAKKVGAVGDGRTDDTAAINKAIDLAGQAGGGVVLLPAGTFRITGPIWVHHSGVVLRGSGKGLTTIMAEQSLAESYFPNTRGSLVQWSFMGGLVWFIPKPHLDTLRANNFFGLETWLGSAPLSAVTGSARRGDQTLTLADSSGIKAGDTVLVCAKNVADSSLLAHLCGDVEGTADYAWETQANRLRPEISTWTGAPNFEDLRWPVQVASRQGRRIRLTQPLRFDLRPEWSPEVRTIGEAIRDSGIEALTIRMREIATPPHNQEPGFNGPCFQSAIDCWARDVHVENADNAFSLIGAKSVTFADTSVGGRYGHHPYMCRVQSHDNLITNFSLLGEARHGVNVEGLSMGNVWTEGLMKHGTFDSHKLIPAENVRTSVTLTNDGFTGGSTDAGPTWGARMCHWNIDVTNGRGHGVRIEKNGPYSAVVGVRGTTGVTDHPRDFPGEVHGVVEALDATAVPDNLYRAQFTQRTGRRSPQVRSGRGAR